MSAVTALLRLLVESDDTSFRALACSKLLSFLGTLKVARDQYNWDVAQLCIDTCGQPIEKLASVNLSVLHTRREPNSNVVGDESDAPPQSVTACSNGELSLPDVGRTQAVSGAQVVNDSITLPLDLDIPWDFLWDDLIEPWPLGTQHDAV